MRVVSGSTADRWGGFEVLLVRATGHDGFVIPKGGWETDEPTAEAAAVRETWEEAGVRGDVIDDIGEFEFKTNKGNAVKMYAFLLKVNEVAEEWPEQRERKWMPLPVAMEAARRRPEQVAVLQRVAGMLTPLLRNALT